MNGELRDRVVLPALIPVGAVVVTQIVVFSLSRVLLASGHLEAVVIASILALGVLVGSAMLAAGRRIRTSTIVGLIVVLGLGTVGAGAAAIQLGPFYEDEALDELTTIAVSADNLVFDTETIEVPASGAIIDFRNDDTQPHNIAIFPSADDLSEVIFRGEIIQGDQNISYEIEPLEPGEYYFHCDVHPNMSGDVVVSEDAGAGAQG